MDGEKILKMLVANAYEGYRASLNGGVNGGERFKWYSNPQIGNLVMEISTISRRSSDNDRIGILKEVGTWGEYLIETLDEREYHWTNAQMVRIPQETLEITI